MPMGRKYLQDGDENESQEFITMSFLNSSKLAKVKNTIWVKRTGSKGKRNIHTKCISQDGLTVGNTKRVRIRERTLPTGSTQPEGRLHSCWHPTKVQNRDYKQPGRLRTSTAKNSLIKNCMWLRRQERTAKFITPYAVQ